MLYASLLPSQFDLIEFWIALSFEAYIALEYEPTMNDGKVCRTTPSEGGHNRTRSFWVSTVGFQFECLPHPKVLSVIFGRFPVVLYLSVCRIQQCWVQAHPIMFFFWMLSCMSDYRPWVLSFGFSNSVASECWPQPVMLRLNVRRFQQC